MQCSIIIIVSFFFFDDWEYFWFDFLFCSSADLQLTHLTLTTKYLNNHSNVSFRNYYYHYILLIFVFHLLKYCTNIIIIIEKKNNSFVKQKKNIIDSI